MKLFELLMETPQEDKVLIQLGRLISSQISPPKNKNGTKVGSLQQFIEQLPDQSKKVLQNKLNDIQLELHSPEKMQKAMDVARTNASTSNELPISANAYWRPSGDFGDYGDPEGTIVLNSNLVGTAEAAKKLAHELRHVLDDSKSQMKGADSKRYNTPRKKEHQNDEFSYLAQPAEINARFIEAMESLSRAIPIIYKLPPEKIRPRVKQAINQALANNRISELFPEREQSKDYKRLMKRALSFAQNEMTEFEQTLADQGRPKQALGNW
jgi:hypothetical protein